MEKQRIFHWQITLLTLLRLVFNISIRMVYPFLSVFARAFNVSLGSISTALTVRSFAGVIAPVVAPVADRYGSKIGMVAGAGLMSLALGLVVFFPVFPAFFVSLSLLYFGLFIFLPSMQSYISEQVAYQKRGKIIAITEMAWALSFIIGMPLVALLISRFGWWSPYPILAFVSIMGLIGVLTLLPKQTTQIQNTSSHFAAILEIFHTPSALAALLMGMFICMANESVVLMFGVWLEDSFGLQLAALGAASLLLGLAELGGEGLTAWLVDRMGKRIAVRAGLMINCVFSLLLPFIGKTVSGALIGLFFYYISFEFVMVSSLPLVTEVFPHRRSILMGLFLAFVSLGRAFGDMLAPGLYAHGMWLNVIVAACCNLLAIAALQRIKITAETV
jgi:predicted MFS family arabinose efflux permease